jgi:hypothetical protein
MTSPTVQPALFGSVQSYATVSADEQFRYTLGRVWEPRRPRLVFVMLNPSTADADQDDPTIRRCRGFADSLDHGGIHVVNLYAFRATKPELLRSVADPIGPENDDHIRNAFALARREGGMVIAAWGSDPGPDRLRAAFVAALAHAAEVELQALRISIVTGQPYHPLYLPRASRPEPWQPPKETS